MAYNYDATYEIVRNRFMRDYGTIHLCGNCKYTIVCPRMKVQCSNKANAEQLMAKKAPFATKIFVEEYVPRNCKKPLKFINVYECDKFVFEK